MVLQEKSLDGLVVLSVNYEELMQRLREISAEIRDKFNFAKKTYLFGSFARKNYTPESELKYRFQNKNKVDIA